MIRRRMSPCIVAVLCSLSVAAAPRDRDDDHDPAVSPQLIQARQKLFGAENVAAGGRIAKDRVIISRATTTTYLVAAGGHLLLLGSCINRPELPTAPLDLRRTP